MSGDTRGFVQVWQLKDIVPGRVALDAIDVRRPPLRARRSWRAGETCRMLYSRLRAVHAVIARADTRTSFQELDNIRSPICDAVVGIFLWCKDVHSLSDGTYSPVYLTLLSACIAVFECLVMPPPPILRRRHVCGRLGDVHHHHLLPSQPGLPGGRGA